MEKGPPFGEPFYRTLRAYELGVGDIAVEALLEERPGALALVVPVVELQALVPGHVLEVELAVG
jgi:hypothetical protein